VCVGVAVLTCGPDCSRPTGLQPHPAPESNQSNSGQVRLPSHQPHTPHLSIPQAILFYYLVERRQCIVMNRAGMALIDSNVCR